MSLHARAAILLFPLALLVAAPSQGAEEPAVLKDLTAVLMLLAMPCGQVVSAVRQADNSYIASCKDGTRYRVFVDAAGRAAAQKL